MLCGVRRTRGYEVQTLVRGLGRSGGGTSTAHPFFDVTNPGADADGNGASVGALPQELSWVHAFDRSPTWPLANEAREVMAAYSWPDGLYPLCGGQTGNLFSKDPREMAGIERCPTLCIALSEFFNLPLNEIQKGQSCQPYANATVHPVSSF